MRDFPGAVVSRVRGVFNSTSNYVLTAAAAGKDRDEAVKEAQLVGIARRLTNRRTCDN